MLATVNDWERPNAATDGFIVPPDEGDRVPTKPNARRKAGSRNTGGVILVDEAVLAPGEKIPPHYHTNLAEFFYVLAGEIRLQIGDQVTSATAGTFAFSPVDNVHGFSNLGSEPARLLIVALPPEPAEQYFEAMERLPPNADAAAWARLHQEYGVGSARPPVES